MSLILSIFLLFIGLAAIILLHLLLAGSFLHRRSTTLGSSSSITLHDVQTNLTPFQYPAADSDLVSDDCSICLEPYEQGETCRVLPVCDHVFHARCVDRWLTKVPSCPICRTRVRLDGGGSSDSGVGDDETKFLWAVGVARFNGLDF
ncbi:RING-H2 finger protein ATL56-like [Bidens hawaiensis]|uniref:RING-H2 finger protein ATL56-like n=1 Tax=Bidens hawaiensis TaxID=980011 RepID=UPI00404AF426